MTELTYIRNTMIANFSKCPYGRVYLPLVLGIREPMNSNLFVGGTYHRALATNFKQKESSRADLLVPEVTDAFSDAWERKLALSEGDDEVGSGVVVWEEPEGHLKDLGYTLVTEYMLTKAPEIQPRIDGTEITYEKALTGKYINTYRTRIDIITEEKPLTVIDHKTVKQVASQNEMDTDLQATGHAYALGKGIRWIRSQAHKTKKKIIDAETYRSKDDISWYKEKVLLPIVAQIEAGIFPAITGWWCGSCFYRQDWCRLPRHFET